MNYLLDTHAVLWIAESSPRLSPKIRALARSHRSDAFAVAAISLLEIARKAPRSSYVSLDELEHNIRTKSKKIRL